MTEPTQGRDLAERLELIESMVLEGRRSTESWGWTFILWGVAYYIAIFWSALNHYYLAWPITMISAGVLMGVIVWRKSGSSGHRPLTTVGRAIWSIWIAMGISMFVILDAIGYSGRGDRHLFMAVMATMLGTANAASSLTLKWKLQFACALVWWATAIVACFGGDKALTATVLGAIFFCQIVFGIYGMIAVARTRKQVAEHA